MMQQEIKIKNEVAWKKHYDLVERQRFYLARYELQRHHYVQEEEKRLIRAFYFAVVGIGLLVWWANV